jgi:hypothetical protein
MAQYAKSEANTEAQFDAACQCFTDAMFEKFRNVPPGQLEALTKREETQWNAAAIFKSCATQSGLN